MVSGHCRTITHKDSKVKCSNSSSAPLIKDPKDASTPRSTSKRSRKALSLTAVKKRQKALHALTRTTIGSFNVKAQAAASSKAGRSEGDIAHTASPSLLSTAKARARKRSGTPESPQRRPHVLKATGTSEAKSLLFKDFTSKSDALMPKMSKANSVSFHAFVSPAARSVSPRSSNSAANPAIAFPASRFIWPSSSPTKYSPERRTAHPRTRSSSS
mmetsp:Transcript_24735/g.61923  ORF Transcript_24735/g.61923 Transcript_24735/m.61923 type:complete len:215 (+) Transcript_24735:1416-2060(+)